MISYTTLGTNDLQRSTRFYDEFFSGLGAQRTYEGERMIGWSVGAGRPMFGIIRPLDGRPAAVGNGAMVAIEVDTPERVAELHEKALSLGGVDEGGPGLRFGTFYAAYFRDLDGNKIALVRM